MSVALLYLSPDAALVLLTIGIILIYIELNRPGYILPGAAGLLVVLIAAAVLAHAHPNIWPISLIFISIAVFLRGVRRDTSTVFYVLATLCLGVGFLRLVPPSNLQHMHAYTALPCAVLLGISTAVLSRIARRARRNKGLD